MILRNMVIDNFFNTPFQVRGEILQEPMNNEVASDGVTYPGIVKIPEHIQKDIVLKIEAVLDSKVKDVLIFARHSLSDMEPPHWAHSDKEMCDYVGLIYMNEAPNHIDDCTFLVEHKKTGMFMHPEDQRNKDLLMTDSNKKNKWIITDRLMAKFNRMNLISADYLHAASSPYGRHRGDSRLVLSVFFRV